MTANIAISGTVRLSAYWLGDAPLTPDTCIAGFTCDTIYGTMSGTSTATGSSLVLTVSNGANDEVAIWGPYKTQMTAADLHIEFEFLAAVTDSRNYSGCAAFVYDDDGYKAYSWWPTGVLGPARVKTDAGGAGELGQQGELLTTLARRMIFQYNNTAHTLAGGEGTNGSTWAAIGSAVSKTLTFPVTYGVGCQPYTAAGSSGFSLANVAADTTLETIGSAPPPDPPDDFVTDTPEYVDPVAAGAAITGQTAVPVANNAALAAAITAAACGTTLQLAAGTYSTSQTISKSCAQEEPVILEGAANWATDFTGTLTVTGARNIVKGIDFSGTTSRVRWGGTNNKLLMNRFRGWSVIDPTPPSTTLSAVAVMLQATAGVGSQGEIGYNEFDGSASDWGTPNGTTQVLMPIKTNEKTVATFHFDAWIHHNYFHDLPEKPDPNDYSSGQSDAIEVCETHRTATSSMQTGWRIEQNLILRHLQGHGVVDLKCGGNIVQRNSVIDSPDGGIDPRFGWDNIIESNYFSNAGGIVSHSRQLIVGNYVTGGGKIALTSGTLAWNDASNTNTHQRSFQTRVIGNTVIAPVKIVVGEYTLTLPADDSDLEDNTGTVSEENETDTTQSGTTTVNYTLATPLTEGEVGPAAATNAASAYKLRRGIL
jgi:hypothetical protein